MKQIKLEGLKKPLIYGVVFLIIVIIIELIIVFGCKDDLGCIGFAFIVLLPSIILGIPQGTYYALITNILFYFLLGSLIGYLLQRYKK